ncbi:hypothetical protein RF11_03900 [Thelohanellus kitauei]|uniref:GOLD domain-containing protein n=1 Tax=Thelohanellus kitauei TaxID=669202 RepID=A0A0C2MRY3_THEKT|nr:hypothetical protein RF11_03900 [Thelohanellus kitauei]
MKSGILELVLIHLVFRATQLRYEVDSDICFYEEGDDKNDIIFYFKVLGGPYGKVGVAVDSSNGTSIYSFEKSEDFLRISPPNLGVYSFCFKEYEDLGALSNEIDFDIKKEGMTEFKGMNMTDEISKRVSDHLMETFRLLDSFMIKLEMNHGDLENDILVVNNLHQRVLHWSLFLTAFIVIFTLIQVTLTKRLFQY